MATTRNIQSVERAFSILELFQQPSCMELSVKDISDSLGLNKSTTFGLINTLTNLGYLHKNQVTQKYMLGLKLLSFSNIVETQNLIIKAVHPFLVQLNCKYGETVHCAIEQNGALLYIDKVVASNMAIYINTQVGASRELYCTGVGKCILAYMSEDMRESVLRKPLKPLTPKTIIDANDIRAELANVRKVGYALDNEENMIGLYCVAVPVFSSKDTVACAISISSIEARIDEAKKRGLVNDLKHTASEISKQVFNYDCYELN